MNPGPIASINTAISVGATAGDIIYLTAGEYTTCTSPILLNKGVTIRGQAGAYINCANSGTAITTGACEMYDLDH